MSLDASLSLPSVRRPRPPSTAARTGTHRSYELVHRILSFGGALLIPIGIVVIVFGWYGAARTVYQADQMTYLVSGGVLGLGITFAGGFLYFGAWLARMAADQHESDAQLGDTLLALADAVSRIAAEPGDAGVVLVTVGRSTVVHRSDCQLVAGRSEVQPVREPLAEHTRCRLCGDG